RHVRVQVEQRFATRTGRQWPLLQHPVVGLLTRQVGELAGQLGGRTVEHMGPADAPAWRQRQYIRVIPGHRLECGQDLAPSRCTPLRAPLYRKKASSPPAVASTAAMPPNRYGAFIMALIKDSSQ